MHQTGPRNVEFITDTHTQTDIAPFETAFPMIGHVLMTIQWRCHVPQITDGAPAPKSALIAFIDRYEMIIILRTQQQRKKSIICHLFYAVGDLL